MGGADKKNVVVSDISCNRHMFGIATVVAPMKWQVSFGLIRADDAQAGTQFHDFKGKISVTQIKMSASTVYFYSISCRLSSSIFHHYPLGPDPQLVRQLVVISQRNADGGHRRAKRGLHGPKPRERGISLGAGTRGLWEAQDNTVRFNSIICNAIQSGPDKIGADRRVVAVLCAVVVVSVDVR